ncbi:MAG: hypothetical protein WC843_06255 [Candidatus Gracilibacteria bacterium]|jgi:TRAP-type C4-dicarboxylate transport system permease small subunit
MNISNLRNNKRAILWIMAIDAALAISSTVVDWPWLIRVPRNLIIFAPICSLYPLLLLIWLTLHYFQKKIPTWFTTFLFMGLVSYGIMSYIYFPLYMSWTGINFHDVGSILWVTAYAIQAFIIAPDLKKIPWYQYLIIFGYFFLKDYSDRYWGTFLDVLLDSYPEYLKLGFTISVVTLHSFAAGLILYFGFSNSKQKLSPVQEPQPVQTFEKQELL